MAIFSDASPRATVPRKLSARYVRNVSNGPKGLALAIDVVVEKEASSAGGAFEKGTRIASVTRLKVRAKKK